MMLNDCNTSLAQSLNDVEYDCRFLDVPGQLISFNEEYVDPYLSEVGDTNQSHGKQENDATLIRSHGSTFTHSSVQSLNESSSQSDLNLSLASDVPSKSPDADSTNFINYTLSDPSPSLPTQDHMKKHDKCEPGENTFVSSFLNLEEESTSSDASKDSWSTTIDWQPSKHVNSGFKTSDQYADDSEFCKISMMGQTLERVTDRPYWSSESDYRLPLSSYFLPQKLLGMQKQYPLGSQSEHVYPNQPLLEVFPRDGDSPNDTDIEMVNTEESINTGLSNTSPNGSLFPSTHLQSSDIDFLTRSLGLHNQTEPNDRYTCSYAADGGGGSSSYAALQCDEIQRYRDYRMQATTYAADSEDHIVTSPPSPKTAITRRTNYANAGMRTQEQNSPYMGAGSQRPHNNAYALADTARSNIHYSRSRSISKMPLSRMYELMGLSNDHNKAKRREERIMEIVRAEGFDVGNQTWIRDTQESTRRRIIYSIYEKTREFGYTPAIIEIIVRRGTYARMQSKLRQKRRHGRRNSITRQIAC